MRIRILAAAALTAIAALASAAPAASAAAQPGSGHAATGASAAASTGQTVLTKQVTRTYRINATTLCRSTLGEDDLRTGGNLVASVLFSQYFCYNGLIVTYESAGFTPRTYGIGGWGFTGRTFSKNCYAAFGSGRPCSGNYEVYHASFCAANPFRGGCSAYWFPTIEQWQKFNGQAWYKLS